MNDTCIFFTRDIDDVVQIGWKNGMMTVRAKADKTTAHIQKLVTKQRVPNKKKYAVHRPNRNGPGPRMYQGGGMQHSQRPRNLMAPHPMVPAYLRHQILEVFKSFPKGLDLIEFEDAFSRLFGLRINYTNYGFPSLFELLKSIPSAVTVQRCENDEWKVRPVNVIKPQNQLQSVESKQIPSGVKNATDTGDLRHKRPSRGRGMS